MKVLIVVPMAYHSSESVRVFLFLGDLGEWGVVPKNQRLVDCFVSTYVLCMYGKCSF